MDLKYLGQKTACPFILCSLSIFSSSALGTETLDWAKCVHIAEEKNFSLKSADASREFAMEKVEAARGVFLPSVSASAKGVRSESTSASSFNGFSMGNGQTSKGNLYSLGLSMQQTIFSGFRNEANLDKARVAARAATISREKALVQLYYDLRKAFDLVLYYQELRLVNGRAIDRRRQNLSIVKLRYEGGRENKGSFLRAEASLLQAQLELAQTTRQLAAARVQLARFLALEGAADQFEVKGSIRSLNMPETKPDFTALASQTVEIRKSLAEIELAQTSIDVERSIFYPEISATAAVTRTESQVSQSATQISYGLNLSMMLYDGGKTPANVRAAALDLARARYVQSDTELSTLATLELLYANLQDVRDRLKLMEKQVEASRVQAQTTRDLYTLGLTGFQIWDQLEADLIANEKANLAARRDGAFAMAEWDKATSRTFKEIAP